MTLSSRVAIYICDNELYDLDMAARYATIEACNFLYHEKRLYKAMPPTPNTNPWIPVCDHNNVGEYLQDLIVNGIPR